MRTAIDIFGCLGRLTDSGLEGSDRMNCWRGKGKTRWRGGVIPLGFAPAAIHEGVMETCSSGPSAKSGRETVSGRSCAAGWRLSRRFYMGRARSAAPGDRLRIEGVSGTSAGAMNAAVLAEGYAKVGRRGRACGACDIGDMFRTRRVSVRSSAARSTFLGRWTMDNSPRSSCSTCPDCIRLTISTRVAPIRCR